ncbi:MAG TPA: acylphosphatase [Blastocatellia bacterium]|nr:acylphosphatase [Blastocatellia bacterium]
MTIARRFIVKGDVQGVGFRWFTLRAARRLGVTGTVRNLPDGTVEAIAEGSADAIDSFRREIERGPSHAQVTSVDVTELPATGRYREFDVSY